MDAKIRLPDGWHSEKQGAFRRTFPDGTDVIISIVRAEESSYEVWCSAEHRDSGPSDAVILRTDRIEEAISCAEKDMQEWNEELGDQ